MSTKDMRQLLRRVRSQGFTWRRARSGHYRVRAPDGREVTVASSPRGSRALRDARADLRRLGAHL